MNNKTKKEYIFSQETIDTLAELGRVLRRINARMNSEGYFVRDGKIVNDKGEEWKRIPSNKFT